jgi:N-acetyl-gamma-glutamyl-phosphate reductase
MDMESIRVGIVEAQTFVARELIFRLLGHPCVRLVSLQALAPRSESLADQFGELRGRKDLPALRGISAEELRKECHAVFVCAPQGMSLRITPELVDGGVRVFDLSSDFRFRDRDAYRRAFQYEHPHPEWNQKAVYGLPEIYRPNLPGASLLALPGCYSTAVILSLAPLMRRDLIAAGSLVADCKAGYSAAEGLSDESAHFCTADSNIMPHFAAADYQVPEIEENLRRLSGERHQVSLMAHLVPVLRGVLATCYLNLSEEMDEEALCRLYEDFYDAEPFVRILPPGYVPRTGDLIGTNFCDIALRLDSAGTRLVVMAALDNLGKGSALQAVQCFNLNYGLLETLGLL